MESLVYNLQMIGTRQGHVRPLIITSTDANVYSRCYTCPVPPHTTLTPLYRAQAAGKGGRPWPGAIISMRTYLLKRFYANGRTVTTIRPMRASPRCTSKNHVLIGCLDV